MIGLKNINKMMKSLNSLEDIINDIEQYKNALLKTNKELQCLYTMLDNVITACGGYIWAKDLDGKYLYCDKSFCKDFFGIIPNVTGCQIQGQTDLELIENFVLKQHKKHTFGKICIATDEIVIQTRETCHFIEKGFIGSNLFALDVIKTPFMKKNEIIGVVGFARRINPEKWEEFLNNILKHSQYTILTQSKENLVIQIHKNSCYYC